MTKGAPRDRPGRWLQFWRLFWYTPLGAGAGPIPLFLYFVFHPRWVREAYDTFDAMGYFP